MNTSFCDIINLKIINRSINETQNGYMFENNLISSYDDFLVDYDLYFYEDFNGIYNNSEKVIYFLIPPESIPSHYGNGGDLYYGNSSYPNQFFLLSVDISPYNNFYINTMPSNEENDSMPSNEGNNSTSSEEEYTEEEVIPLPDDFEPPEVAEASEGEYTILAGNTRHISKFCKLSKIYIINVYEDNSIDYSISSFSIGDIVFSNSNGIIPLIPCAIMMGYWKNDQSDDKKWLILPDTYQKTSRSFEGNKPISMSLDNSGVFKENSDIVTTYFNYNNINLTVTHQMEEVTKENFLTVWGTNINIGQSILIDNNIENAITSFITVEANEDVTYFYCQILISNNNDDEIIWRSNLCQYNHNDKIEILPIRYYDTKNLDDNYVRIYGNKGSYIAIYIRITARKLDKIQLSYGYSRSEVENNPILFYEKENLNIRDATKQVYIITRENQSGQNKLLKSDSAIYFKLVTSMEQDGGGYIDSTSYYACPAKEKTYPILDVEPYGVAIGQASTGVQGRPLFEVSSNYTTRFYGPVEIFPVGAIYMSMSPENPSKYFYGIWAPWAQGRMPIGVSTAEEDVEFNSAGLIGGEKAHKLTKEEMPSHTHGMNNIWSGGTGSTTAYKPVSNRKRTTKTTTSTGGNQPHNNMPPYITCYMWQRIE